MESPCSIQWLAASILICISKALAESSQAVVSKHFLASAIVTGFGVCVWDGSPGGWVREYPHRSRRRGDEIVGF